MNTYIDAFYNKKFGIFNHFLYSGTGTANPTREEESAAWNKKVWNLDVEKLAYNLHLTGAGYYFITVMQGNRFMLAPNVTFDKIAGTLPGEACAERDTIADLINALDKYGIDLCLYYTGDGPYKDPIIGPKFGFAEPRGPVNEAFVQNWAAVLQEYSERYGDKIKAWWIDGCYSDFFHYTPELLSYYHKAIKAGNPNALVAFNNGVTDDFAKWYPEEEITAGEFNELTHFPKARFIDGAQAHILAPLGVSPTEDPWGRWCKPGCSLTREELRDYLNKLHAAGGVASIDIYIDESGNWDPQQLAMLTGILSET